MSAGLGSSIHGATHDLEQSDAPYGTPTRNHIEKALSYFVSLVLILLTVF